MKTYQIPVPTFDLDHTLRCGQVFRWRESKDGWIDIVIKVKQEGDVLIVKSNLDMEDVMPDICSINNRIPQIGSMIQNLCTQLFGENI